MSGRFQVNIKVNGLDWSSEQNRSSNNIGVVNVGECH